MKRQDSGRGEHTCDSGIGRRLLRSCPRHFFLGGCDGTMGGLDGLLVVLLQVDDVVTTGLYGAYAY